MERKHPRALAIAVCGTSTPSPDVADLADELGFRIVAQGWTLICGGMGGIMEAACRGGQRAKLQGAAGLVVGILPGGAMDSGNPYCDVVIPSGMGVARNLLVVRSGDAVVLVGGGSGTLSEAAFAWQFNKPLYSLRGTGGWAEKLADSPLDDRRSDLVVSARSPAHLIEHVQRSLL